MDVLVHRPKGTQSSPFPLLETEAFPQSIFKRSAGLLAKAPSSYTTENSAPPSTTAALPTAAPSTTFGCLSFADAQFTPSVESATSASFRVLLRGAQVPALETAR